jgi:AmiR/NasT family two-component response regulator
VLCAPVEVDDQLIGAICLYGDRPHGLAGQQLAALLAAEHAGLLLRAVRERDPGADQAAGLSDTLATGEVIGQAVGVVMAQRRCSAAAALRVLREASGSLSIPLAEVAHRLVASVTGPDEP